MAILEVSKQITNYLDSEQTASAPANPVEGQRWTDTSKSPPVAMIYKDGVWEPEHLSVEVLDPDFYQDLEKAKTEVANAVEKAEAAEQAGKDAQTAGENAANLAAQAQLEAQAAKAKADAIEIDVTGIVADVATIQSTATDAYNKAVAAGGAINELEATVDGQKQTIATVQSTADTALSKANIVDTTVNGMTQTISEVKTSADSALTKVTQVEASVNGLKTTISTVETTANSALSKALQVEATANGLISTVTEVKTDLNNLSTSARNLLTGTATFGDKLAGNIDTGNAYNGNSTLKGTFSNNYVDTYRQKTASIPRDGKFTITFWAKGDRNLSFSNYFYGTGSTTSVINSDGKTGTSSDGNNALTATTSWKRYWITWTQQGATANKEVILGRLFSAGSVWINSPILIEGVVPTDWMPAPEDLATTSQITQLATDINLKVDKNGIISQINVSSEGILIDGKYTWITGTTKIDNAVIKTANIAELAITTAKIADLAVNNAKIASLDAAKINTGYLAAARIAAKSITVDKLNVATLSAIAANLGNVTAGTINGVEIIGGSYTQSATLTDPTSGSSGTSEIKIAGGVLYNSFANGTTADRQTSLSSGVLRFYTQGSEVGRVETSIDLGTSTTPAIHLKGTYVGVTSTQRGWIDLSANGIFDGNTFNGYTVDAASNTGNYIGFNRKSPDKMNLYAGKTNDGAKRLGSDDLYATSGSGKALHITSGGTIVAYSSSERFKEYIEVASDVNPKSLLDLELKSWIYKSSHSLVSVGEPIRRVYGLIAEDVERVGLNQYVERDLDGLVEGYKPELWTVTIPILKEHEESIEMLKQRVNELEKKVEDLQAA